MDLITSVPETSKGKYTVVTFVDRFSKMVHFRAAGANVSAADVAYMFLDCVLSRYGVPEQVISDRDPRFVAHFWRALMEILGTQQSLSTAYHPETDGQSERMHRTVEQVLRCYTSPLQRDWDMFLPAAEFAINSTRSLATGKSPFEVIFGRLPLLPVDASVSAVTDCKVESATQFCSRMTETMRSV